MVTQIHRKFTVFYGTRRVVAMFSSPLDPTSYRVHKPATVATGPHELKIALIILIRFTTNIVRIANMLTARLQRIKYVSAKKQVDCNLQPTARFGST